MLSRVADELFWLSRYVERAVATCRLVDVTLQLELDTGDLEDDVDLWEPLLGPEVRENGAWPFARGDGHLISSRDVRYFLTFDTSNPNSLVECIRRARAAARGVRESVSSEMWEQLNTLYLSLADSRLAERAEENPHAFYRRVREGAQFFQGLSDCTLAHGEDWQFVRLGMYLERASNVARAVRLQSHLLRGGGDGRWLGDETVRWLAVLRSCGSAEAYSRYYSMRVEPARVLEFLLLNPIFPQSIRFSLDAAWSAMEAIEEQARDGGRRGSNPAVRSLGLLQARLEHTAVDEVLEQGLDDFLGALQADIAAVSDNLARTVLRGEPHRGRSMPVARAAALMAAQQQQ